MNCVVGKERLARFDIILVSGPGGWKLACSCPPEAAVLVLPRHPPSPPRPLQAGDDVQNKKPDPEIYNTARGRLGLPADRCLVVEDSLVGLRAAVGAQMVSGKLGIPESLPPTPHPPPPRGASQPASPPEPAASSWPPPPFAAAVLPACLACRRVL